MFKKNSNLDKIRKKAGLDKRINSNNLFRIIAILSILFMVVSVFYGKEDISNPENLGEIEESSEITIVDSDIDDESGEASDIASDIEKEQDFEYGDIDEDTGETPKKLEDELEKDDDDSLKKLNGKLKVHFIDVGQGDAALIEAPTGKTTLIDGGIPSKYKTISSYLSKNNIDNIDYVIATHPHNDHIGSLSEILFNYDVDAIYMPNISHTTKSFQKLIEAIDKTSTEVILAENVGTIENSDGYVNEILFPYDETENLVKVGSKPNLNLYSIINKVSFGDTSFLFTGDTEIPVENIMVQKYGNSLKSDVIKVPHHGSKTSSSKYFLDAVDPEIAVFTYAIDNEYGLPDDMILNRYQEKGIEMLDTAIDGNIVIESDGYTLDVYSN